MRPKDISSSSSSELAAWCPKLKAHTGVWQPVLNAVLSRELFRLLSIQFAQRPMFFDKVSFVCRAAVVAVGFLLLQDAHAASPDDDCLFADNITNLETSDCKPDPMHLKDEPVIRSALQAVGVPGSRIEMRGCAQASFRTTIISSVTRLNTYLIIYPTIQGYIVKDYFAPIIHELGHVSQLESAGSIGKLRAELKNSSERIELGADFLAGIIFRRHTNGLDRGLFQRSARLLGSYRSDIQWSHGTPERRISAFRHGFYHTGGEANLVQLSELFQADLFGSVTSFGRNEP